MISFCFSVFLYFVLIHVDDAILIMGQFTCGFLFDFLSRQTEEVNTRIL